MESNMTVRFIVGSIICLVVVSLVLRRQNIIKGSSTLSVSSSGGVVVNQDVVQMRIRVLNGSGNLNQRVANIKKILDNHKSATDIEISYQHESYYDAKLKRTVQGNLISNVSFIASEQDVESIQPLILDENINILSTSFTVSKTALLTAEKEAIKIATRNAIDKGEASLDIVSINGMNYSVSNISIQGNYNNYPRNMAMNRSSEIEFDNNPKISGGEREIVANVSLEMSYRS
jgi:hypothetical protein